MGPERPIAAGGIQPGPIWADALTKIKGGLRAVYRTLELPGKNPLKDAHAALDAAVLDAYGFSAPFRAGSVSARSRPLAHGRGSDPQYGPLAYGRGSDRESDLLRQLLDLNLEVAARIDAGQSVTAPGVPPEYPNPGTLVTTDCIKPLSSGR